LLADGRFRQLAQASIKTIMWTVFFGAVWGIGGLTFGLTMRYLSVADVWDINCFDPFTLKSGWSHMSNGAQTCDLTPVSAQSECEFRPV
jgi:hypothetical protein